MVTPLEAIFPGLLKSGYQLTSPSDRRYNCIAWAAGDAHNWWWPGPNLEDEYWPPGILRNLSLASFQAAFATLDYEVCAHLDVEQGFEKLALYADADDKPTHAARQLPNGRWTSKLGMCEDIEHEAADLEGAMYGRIVLVMRRPAT